MTDRRSDGKQAQN